MAFSRAKLITGLVATSALVLAGCSSGGEDDAAGGGGESYRIGINQLVQHPALDSATAGFKEAFSEAMTSTSIAPIKYLPRTPSDAQQAP